MPITSQEFTIYSEAVGTIELVAELSSASPALVAYVNENRTYLDSVKSAIDQDLALFNSAVMSDDPTYLDSSGASRLSWKSLEDFVSGFDYVNANETLDEVTLHLGEVDTQLADLESTVDALPSLHSAYNNRLNSLESGAGSRLVRIVSLESQQQAMAASLGTVILVNDQQSNAIDSLEGAVEGFTERLDNVEVTYADQNVLIDTQQGITTDHEYRLALVEAATDIQVQIARFEAIENVNTQQDQSLDDLALDLASEITDREAAVTHEAEQRFLWDTTLQGKIDDEEAARIAADTALTGLLDDEVVDRLGADSVLDGRITNETVKLTGDQNIAGVKTFTSNMIIEGNVDLQGTLTTKNAESVELGDNIVVLNAGETGSASVDAGIEVERGTDTNASLIWDESTDKWSAGYKDFEKVLATEEFANNKFVALTGTQTIAGGKTFTSTPVIQGDTASAILAIDTKTAGNSFVSFRRNGANESAVYSLDDRLLLRREGTTDTDLSIYDSYISANAVIRASEPVDDKDLTTKKFVDDNFLSLSGGELTSNLAINRSSGNPALEFEQNDVNVGTVVAYSDRIRLQHRGNTFQVYESVMVASSVIRAADPITTTDLTTKGYVEDNFLTKAGTTTNGNLTITRDNDFDTYLELDAYAGRNGIIRFQSGNTDRAYIKGLEAQLQLVHTHSAGGSDPYFALYDDSAAINVPLTGATPTSAGHLTRKDYVDGTFLKLTGGEASGNLAVKNASPYMTLDSTSGNCNFQMRYGGKRDTLLYTTGTRMNLIQYEDDQVTAANYIAFDKEGHFIQTSSEIRGVAGTTGNTLTTKGYVDDNFLPIAGGTVSGDLTLTDTNDLYLNLESDANPVLIFKSGGSNAGRIYANDTGLLLTHYDENSVQNSLRIHPDHVLSDSPIRLPAQGSDTLAATRKDYVDDNFLKLTGGILTGNVIINATVPRFYLDATTGNDSAQYFRANGKQRAVIFNDESLGRFKILKYAADGTTTDNFMEMRSDNTYFDKAVLTYADQHADANALTRKDYVDSNFLNRKASAKIEGNLEVEAPSAVLTIDAEGATTPAVNMVSENVVSMQLYYVNAADRVSFIKRDTTARSGGGVSNSFNMYSDRTHYDKDVRVSVMGSNEQSLTTKKYVDDAIAAAIAAL